MRQLPLEELASQVRPFPERAGFAKISKERLLPLCVMFRERANNLAALAESFRPLLVPAAERLLGKGRKEAIYPERQGSS